MIEQKKGQLTEVKTLISDWRNGIITNVLSDGLIASGLLQKFYNLQPESRSITYLGSNDSAPMMWLAGCPILTPQNCVNTDSWRYLPNPFDAHLAQRFYLGEMSIFPVLLERSWEKELHSPDYYEGKDTTHILSIFEQRVSASFLVVAPLSQNLLEHNVKWLPPEEFIAVIFPKDIWDDYTKAHKTPTIPFQLIVIDDKVTQPIGNTPFPLNLPNYEKIVKSLMNQQQKDLWIHAVRLPIEEDLQRVSKPGL